MFLPIFVKIHQNKVEDLDPLTRICSVTNPCKANEGQCYHDQQCSDGLKCGQSNCPVDLGYRNTTNCCYEHCNEWLDLEAGILKSPGFPSNYANEKKCSWTISAPRNHFVTLEFTDFKVYCFIITHEFSLLAATWSQQYDINYSVKHCT